MTPPVIPVPPAIAPSWHPGATVLPVRHVEPCVYHDAPAKRVIDGRQLCVKIGTDYYLEFPRAKRDRSLSELLHLGPPPASTPADPNPLHASALLEMEGRAGFQFYERQRDIATRVAAVSGALIAAEVGCGKTLLAISLVHLLQPRRCLIIAPQGVASPRKRRDGDETVYDASQWQREFQRFAPWIHPRYVSGGLPDGDGVFITYMQDALLNDGGWLKDVAPDHFDMIVVDEAHLLMNAATHMGRALYRMEPARRYALTATPIPNHVEECIPLLHWLRPDAEMPWPPPREHIDTGSARVPVAKPLLIDSPLLLGAELRQVVAAVRKRDIRPDLPQLTIHKVMVDPEPELAARYAETEQHFTLKRGGAGQVERARLTRLRNICAESRAKAALIASRACGSHSVIVSARTSQSTMIERTLRSIRRTGRIDSTTDPKQHGAVSAAFQSGALDNLLMGIRCAYGHSFPDCDTIHVASQEWSYGAFEQAVGRVYRVNSQRPVHAYVYLLRGTIEERMFDTVCAKRSAAERILFGEDPGLSVVEHESEKALCLLQT